MLTTEELNIAIEELLVKARSVFDKYDGAFTAIGTQKDGAVSELNALHTQLMDDLQALANGVGLEHEWDGTSVRFKQNDGTWGSWVNLQAPSSFDYEQAGNPGVNTNPTTANAKWLNISTAELFVCTDNTTDANIWIGSAGTTVQPNALPTNPTNSFPANLYNNQTYSHTFGGATDSDGTITHYVVDQISSANLTVATAEVAAGSAHEFNIADIASDETVTFRVRSKDDYGSYSIGITVTVQLKLSSIGVPGTAGFGVGIAPDSLVTAFNLTPMTGYSDPTHDNYGNYTDASGSVLCYIPKHYVKKTHDTAAPYNGLRIDISGGADVGYALPRCFVNNGVEVAGIFVDKFQLGKEGTVGVSKRNLDPVSTNSAHNPISALTANGQSPAQQYDGMYAAVKSRGDNYSLESIFVFTMLADLADSHYQACFRAGDFSSCAWADVAPYQPKGCNNNALADNDDASVTYTGSGYSNCGLTGGVPDAVFAKITHNGQKCGVADLNGNMWEVVAGYITDASGNHFVLKESVDIKSLTASAAYDTANYDAITIPLTLDNTQVAFGNGTNQFFSGSTDRNSDAYRLDNIGLPMADTAVSSAGTARYGQDGFWRYQTNSLCPIAGGNWIDAALSGVRARYLSSPRADSSTVVGGRACLIPSVAG